MQFWFQLGLFGQANVPIVQKLYKHIINLILLFVLRGIIFDISKRPLFGLPVLCQHKQDMMETLLFKNVIRLFKKINPIVRHEQ